MSQPVYLLVNRRILFYIGVRSGHVGFRLVVIVIGYEVFHRIAGKEAPVFGAELGCKRFVMAQNQRGTLHLRDDVGHGEGLARAGRAE